MKSRIRPVLMIVLMIGLVNGLSLCLITAGCKNDIQPASLPPESNSPAKEPTGTASKPANDPRLEPSLEKANVDGYVAENAGDTQPMPKSMQTIGAENESSQTTATNQTSDVKTNTLSILAWNVESGGADPNVIATQLSAFSGYDIFCLSEVHPDDFETYRTAAGSNFDSVSSKSGNEDRLQILFDKDRFELLQSIELSKHGDYVLNNDRHRSPTAARLRDRKSNKTFIVMVNHLARGNGEFRTTQAVGLREWARDQNIAIINVGDFNMDYVFETKKGNEALDAIRQDNIWSWIEPEEWIDSNWWDPENDGIDNFEGSLLDLVFVAGEAKEWKPSCKILVREKDFPDDATTSDHRPVHAEFKF